MAKIFVENFVFQPKRKKAADWTSENPILRDGEFGVVTDGSDGEWLKVGDGVTAWNSLSYKKGPKGDPGAQGVKGDKGDKGDKGTDGYTPQKGVDYFTPEDIASLNIPSVDQTYTPESENAQSGTAVAEAVAIEQNRADNTFSNALKGNKSDTAMLLDDVSPVTHDMGVKVRKVNLFDVSKIQSINGITNNGDGTLTLVGGRYAFNTGLKLSDLCPDLKVGDTVFLSATTTGVGVCSFGSSPVWTYNTSLKVTENAFKDQLYLYGKNSNASDYNEPHTISNIQIEYGEKATTYTPYVPDLTAVKVSRCGKNLVDVSSFQVGKTIRGGGSGQIIALKDDNIYATCPKLKVLPNTTYTFSLDNSIYWLDRLCEMDSNDLCVVNYPWYAWGNDYSEFSFTTKNTTDYLVFQVKNKNGETVTLEDLQNINLQIELGTTATEYEPYTTPTEYTPTADGTVNGVTSLYPNTTLTTDTDGVLIDCEYNRDINKAFAALEAAIATNNS